MSDALDHHRNAKQCIGLSRELALVATRSHLVDIALAEFDFDDVFTLGNPQPKLKSVVEVQCRQPNRPRMTSYDSNATASESELSGVEGHEFR
jgi:hypothetical protein